MRQLVFVVLVAAFLWWGYGSWSGSAAAADGGALPAAPVAGSAGAVTGARLDEVFGAPPPASQAGALAANNATATLANELVAQLGAVAPGAVDAAWSALAQRGAAQLAVADRRRLAAALAVPADSFPALLAQLGTYNTFLHSSEGRAQAQKVFATTAAMVDAEAVAAGTQFLMLCLRGSIEKADVDARAFVDEAYRQHRLRSDRWLCNPANVAGARSYTVAPGDTLAEIAARFRRDKVLVDEGTIAVLNSVHNPNLLQPGQKLKIPVEPLSAVVEKRSFSLVVLVGPHLLRLYWVGHGENDITPVTEFTVGKKAPRPPWTAPDGNTYPYGHPKNILGEYFIAFNHESRTGFGAHGTPMPETICTMSSMGCVRLLAPDIAELFKILPRGAKVVVKASQASP